MALVTFEDFSGGTIDVNPAMVASVVTYQHFDHDMELPDEHYHMNAGGLKEVRPDNREEADALRTSPRTIINVGGASFIVKGTVDEVKKALSGSQAQAQPAKSGS